jgi:hypothetical protein
LSVQLTPSDFEKETLRELITLWWDADAVAAEMGVEVNAEWREALLSAILRRWFRDDDDRTLIRLYDAAGRHNPRGLEEELRARGFRFPLRR